MSDQTEQTTEQLLTQLESEMQAMRQAQEAAAHAQRTAVPAKSADEVIAQFQAQAAAQAREAERKAAEEAEANEPSWWDSDDLTGTDAAPDPVDVARRAEASVRKDLEARNKELQERLDAIEAQQQEVAGNAEAAARVAMQDRQQRFASELDRLDPDFFEHVNGTPGWGQFLEQINPTTMTPYGEALKTAYAQGNAQQAFNLAQLYRAQARQQAPQDPQAPPPAGQVVQFPGGRAAHVDAPSRGAARVPSLGSGTGQPGAVIYTPEVLAGFQRRMREEKWTKQQKDALFADIKLAEAQGRLRG